MVAFLCMGSATWAQAGASVSGTVTDQTGTNTPRPAPAARSTHDPCTGLQDFANTDCTLTWHGITVYGTYDVGIGWVSHGLPVNGYNYEGESLVNRNGYQH